MNQGVNQLQLNSVDLVHLIKSDAAIAVGEETSANITESTLLPTIVCTNWKIYTHSSQESAVF
jgi:hypothetical protein